MLKYFLTDKAEAFLRKDNAG